MASACATKSQCLLLHLCLHPPRLPLLPFSAHLRLRLGPNHESSHVFFSWWPLCPAPKLWYTSCFGFCSAALPRELPHAFRSPTASAVAAESHLSPPGQTSGPKPCGPTLCSLAVKQCPSLCKKTDEDQICLCIMCLSSICDITYTYLGLRLPPPLRHGYGVCEHHTLILYYNLKRSIRVYICFVSCHIIYCH